MCAGASNSIGASIAMPLGPPTNASSSSKSMFWASSSDRMTSPYRDQSTAIASIFHRYLKNGDVRVSPTQQLSNQSEANDLNDDRYASVNPAQGN